MSVNHPRTRQLRDPELAAVEILLSHGVPPPLEAAVAEVGSEIVDAKAAQVTWWPAASITVRYKARLRGGALDGEHELVAVSGKIPERAIVVENGDTQIGVWRVPHDPALPGLALAMDAEATRRLLIELGADDDEVTTRLRAYRPGSRAVVEVAGRRTSFFLKMVPPRHVERLHAAHQSLPSGLPVPHSLGYSKELGIIALQALPGRTLRDAMEDTAAELPVAGDLTAMLDALPAAADGRVSASAIDNLPKLADLLMRLLPRQTSRIEDLVGRIGEDAVPATVPVHGDFYESQLLVDKGRIRGLLDVDTFGLGRPGDDPATMLSHLDLWRSLSAQPERVRAFAESLLRSWDVRVDPVDLRRRVAATAVGLATGPFRVQRNDWPTSTMKRLDIALRWMDSAARIEPPALAVSAAHPSVRHPLRRPEA